MEWGAEESDGHTPMFDIAQKLNTAPHTHIMCSVYAEMYTLHLHSLYKDHNLLKHAEWVY